MTNTQQFYAYLLNHPGATIEAMSEALKCSKDSCYQYVSRMQKEGRLISTGTRPKEYHLTEKVALATIEKPVKPTLAMPHMNCETPCSDLKAFSPRELLEELKSRGYVWEKMYVKQYVDYSKI